MDTKKLKWYLLRYPRKRMPANFTIPVFLEIDGETLCFSLRSMGGLVFAGVNALENARAVAAQAAKATKAGGVIKRISTPRQLAALYKLLEKAFEDEAPLSPPQIVIFENVDKLWAHSRVTRKRLFELANKSGWARIFKIATSSTVLAETGFSKVRLAMMLLGFECYSAEASDAPNALFFEWPSEEPERIRFRVPDVVPALISKD